MRISLLSIFACLLLLPGGGPTVQAFEEDQAKERDRYQLMKLFVETFQQIEANYVRDVDRRELMEAAIRGMLTELDQYSSFIPPRSVKRFTQMVEQEFGGIGISVNVRNQQVVVVSPLPGTPAHKAGIRAGDIIWEVEGEPAKDLQLSGVIGKLQGPIGRPVTLSVLHAGEEEPVEMTLSRELIKSPTIRGERYKDDASWDYMLKADPKIGYVRMSQFSRYTAEELRDAVDNLVADGMQGLVLDLRFNPGGLLESAIEIADMFLASGEIVSVKGRNVSNRSWNAQQKGTYADFPMAVLVNAYSASASEVLSACLQDNKRAVVVGERTWGKGSVQNVIRLEDGESALKLTTASYHRPSGVNIHRFPKMRSTDIWGVTPDEGFTLAYTAAEWRDWDADRDKRDIVVDPGLAEESNFDDRQLSAAVGYIEEKLATTVTPVAPVSKPDETADTEK